MADRKNINCIISQAGSGLVILAYFLPWVDAGFIGSMSGFGIVFEIMKHTGDAKGDEALLAFWLMAVFGGPVVCHIINLLVNFKNDNQRLSSFITGVPIAIWLLTIFFILAKSKGGSSFPSFFTPSLGFGPILAIIGMIGALIFSLRNSIEESQSLKPVMQRSVDSFCGECGARLLSGDRFCPSCGARTES